MQYVNNLRANSTPIDLYWIPAYTNIKENEEADVTAKEAIEQTRAKKQNRKWKMWDSRYTAKRQVLGRARATIKLVLKQKTLRLQEET